MAFTAIAGYGGTALKGATDLNVTGWSGTLSNGELETTNTSTSGNYTCIAGINSGEFTVKACWDTTATPNGSGIIQGTSGTFTLNVGAHNYSFTGLVTSVKIDSDVKGLVTYEATIKATGAVTYT